MISILLISLLFATVTVSQQVPQQGCASCADRTVTSTCAGLSPYRQRITVRTGGSSYSLVKVDGVFDGNQITSVDNAACSFQAGQLSCLISSLSANSVWSVVVTLAEAEATHLRLSVGSCRYTFALSLNLPTIVEIAQTSAPEFSSLVSAVVATGLVQTLSGDGPFTVFAPTNAAFANSNLGSLSPAQLKQVLLYHVVSGRVLSSDLSAFQAVPTAQGASVSITSGVGGVVVNGVAKVTSANIIGCNGVIHVIDHVLIPPCGGTDSLRSIVEIAEASAQASAPEFSSLVSAVVATELVQTLSGPGPFTVFAPTDAAFENANLGSLSPAQLKQVLLYHVVVGRVLSSDLSASQVVPTAQGAIVSITSGVGGVVVNGVAKVTSGNIIACNGVIHVIDHVLIPPCGGTGPLSSIVDYALGRAAEFSEFSTLTSLLGSADLVSTLSGPGPFTVFAPTNAAFASANLGSPSADQVKQLLLYHVVPGRVLSSDLSASQVVPTAQGSSATITVQNGVVRINGATVVTANIQNCNGVIHVIDQVLTIPVNTKK